MMHMDLEHWAKLVPEQARSRVFRTISMYILPLLPSRWLAIGAFLAADKEIIDYLKYNLRSQMFAKSLPMIYVKGALKRLDMLKNKPELKQMLWENVNALQNGLKERGFDIGTTSSCVTPVYLSGSIPEAMALVRDLRENYGIFCSIVVYPVIPKGMILLENDTYGNSHNAGILRKLLMHFPLSVRDYKTVHTKDFLLPWQLPWVSRSYQIIINYCISIL